MKENASFNWNNLAFSSFSIEFQPKIVLSKNVTHTLAPSPPHTLAPSYPCPPNTLAPLIP